MTTGIFAVLGACIVAIKESLDHDTTRAAHPFRWSRTLEDFVASWKRGRRQDMES